jgi:hypothetical protein
VDSEASQEQEAGFDLGAARLGDFYPADDVLAEIGRVTMAAARVDRQLALILVAVRYGEPFDVLLTWQSKPLVKEIRKELRRLYEGDLLALALAAVDDAARRLEKRHAVVHSLWEPDPADTMFKVQVLAGLSSQAELDELVRERGRTTRYQTRHPRSGDPGPQETAELEQIRTDLEDSKYALDRLRYTLASALFAGSPAGARTVLPLEVTDRRTEPDRSGGPALTATETEPKDKHHGR